MGTVPRPPRPGKSLAELKPDKSLEWDYEKNYPYTPETVAAESKSKFWWICRVDVSHAWEQTANARKDRYGCPGCSGQKTFKGSNDLATTHPELCLEWHPDNTVTPQEISKGSDFRARWICGKDDRHVWETSPYERTRKKGTGCPACAGRMLIVGVNDLATTHHHLADEWHPIRNERSSSEFMSGSHHPVWWRCSADSSHAWKARVEARTRLKTGCPYCVDRHSSKVEGKIRESLSQLETLTLIDQTNIALNWNTNTTANIDILGQCRDGRLVVIEFDGAYWHRNRKENDTQKSVALLASGYVVIRIREHGLDLLDIDQVDFYQVNTKIVTPQNTDERVSRIASKISLILSAYDMF